MRRLTSIERIPVSPEVAHELGIVAGSARRRILTPVALAVPTIWSIGFIQMQTYGIAEALVQATLVTVVGVSAVAAFAAWWTRRIASASFIIRERGHFGTGGALRAWFYQDQTLRSIQAASGPLRLDRNDDPSELARIWAGLIAREPRYDWLEIDYTPHRYVLLVRDRDGRVIFTRARYVAPASTSVGVETMTDAQLIGSLNGGWRGALIQLLLGLACAAGGVALVVGGFLFATQGPPSLPSTLIVGFATLVFIGLAVVVVKLLPSGLFRTIVLARQEIMRIGRRATS